MATRNHRVRFMDNNYHEDTSITITKSSELSGFPLSNSKDTARFRQHKFAGNFTIDATNNRIYIDEGGGQIPGTLVSGNYTPATLAAEIQTRLNAIGANAWTCTYNTSTYSFEITASPSSTLLLSNQTNAVWDTIGFITTTDKTGTSFSADEQRNHTSEWIQWDLGVAQPVNFFAMIGKLSETFTISSQATITLEGNNINDFSAAPLSRTLTRSDLGVYEFLDDLTDTTYRYWRLTIVDKFNLLGPEGIAISHLYLGDYTTLSKYNVATGFNKAYVDPSQVAVSESGAEYFNERQKYLEFSNLNIQYTQASDRRELEQLFYDKGISTAFYICFDPTLKCSEGLEELTKFVRFREQPTFSHVLADTYALSFNIKEIV